MEISAEAGDNCQKSSVSYATPNLRANGRWTLEWVKANMGRTLPCKFLRCITTNRRWTTLGMWKPNECQNDQRKLDSDMLWELQPCKRRSQFIPRLCIANSSFPVFRIFSENSRSFQPRKGKRGMNGNIAGCCPLEDKVVHVDLAKRNWHLLWIIQGIGSPFL